MTTHHPSDPRSLHPYKWLQADWEQPEVVPCVYPASSPPPVTAGHRAGGSKWEHEVPTSTPISPAMPGWTRHASWSRMFWIHPRRGSLPYVCWPQDRPSCWWRSRIWYSGAPQGRSLSCLLCPGAQQTRPRGHHCGLAQPHQNGWDTMAAARTGTRTCWVWRCGLSLDGGKERGVWGCPWRHPASPCLCPELRIRTTGGLRNSKQSCLMTALPTACKRWNAHRVKSYKRCAKTVCRRRLQKTLETDEDLNRRRARPRPWVRRHGKCIHYSLN